MKITTMVMALSLGVAGALSAQVPAQAPAAPPPAALGRGYSTLQRAGADLDRAREMELVAAARADAQGGNPMERYLVPPEVIMRRQREIGLQPAQRTQITQIIGRLEASLVELQWSMQEEQQALTEGLRQPTVDESATMALLDRVLAREVQVKRVHFQALLQIRNVLTAEQRDRLLGGAREPLMRDDER